MAPSSPVSGLHGSIQYSGPAAKGGPGTQNQKKKKLPLTTHLQKAILPTVPTRTLSLTSLGGGRGLERGWSKLSDFAQGDKRSQHSVTGLPVSRSIVILSSPPKSFWNSYLFFLSWFVGTSSCLCPLDIVVLLVPRV